jgi:diketogulonate reductase-like aldo/keto reductase
MAPTVTLDGQLLPALGQGTWNMGAHLDRRTEELAALQRGLDLGLRVIDTAEMYGDGDSERLVGEAIRGRRDEVYLVSKVLPQHAGRVAAHRALESSLRRLGTDRLDLYLLHWRGRVPLAETVEIFETLRSEGLIRAWGVSNFGPDDLQELRAVPGGDQCRTNQVLYNLTRRGIEFDLLPESRRSGTPIMAYSPVEQGRLLNHPALSAVAADLKATPAQVALAWTLRGGGVLSVPKAASVRHVEENRAALDLTLGEADLQALDAAFPAPTRPRPLEMI